MYLPDINVWIAIGFDTHAHHVSARSWFNTVPTDHLCYFCRQTQLGFLRIINNPAALGDSAITQNEAWHLYDQLLGYERVSFAVEPSGMETAFRHMTAGKLYSTKTWNDAYLAAFAQTVGFEIVSFDKGFSSYPNLQVTILP